MKKLVMPLVVLALIGVISVPTRSPAQRGSADHQSGAASQWADAIPEAGQQAHGVYLGAAFVHALGAQAVVEQVRDNRMNAVVLDVKDAEGRVHYDTQVPELQFAKTGWLGDTRALIQTLHENHVYVVARLTCFADRALPERVPDRAIQHVRREGRIWTSWGTGGSWLDPYNPANHQMVTQMAREIEALGFDEIQLDYVRFPVDDGTQYARYPAQSDRPRREVLLRMLRGIDEAVHIPLGVDVFGLSAYRRGDPSRLGQDLEAWVRHVEVYTPMLYINSMRNWQIGVPNRTYRLVFEGIRRLRERVGPTPVIRPFLQAFSQGAGQEFNVDFIHQQIRAARGGGADGFLFWHPGHTYGMVRRSMQGPSRSIVPFPIRASVVSRRRDH